MLRRLSNPLIRATRQLSSPAPQNADVLRAVQTIMREKASTESPSLKDDLQLKFHVLSACERHFRIAIPHKALVNLVDANAIAAFFDGALMSAEAAEREQAQHWSTTLPSNVNMVGFVGKHEERNEHLQDLLRTSDAERATWNPARG